MRRTRDRPNAMMAGTTPGWLETFIKCNEMLEKVHKNLEDYLETKRMAFPRFYFLSNDELLEILSQTKNCQAVQPHMAKCFDGIRRLDFGDDPKSIEISAMISGEGERVRCSGFRASRGLGMRGRDRRVPAARTRWGRPTTQSAGRRCLGDRRGVRARRR